MAEPSRDAVLAAFKQTFRQLAPYKHRYEVFKDFVTVVACSLHNGVHKDEVREEEYLAVIGQYKTDDQQAFPKLMAQLVAALDEEPRKTRVPQSVGQLLISPGGVKCCAWMRRETFFS